MKISITKAKTSEIHQNFLEPFLAWQLWKIQQQGWQFGLARRVPHGTATDVFFCLGHPSAVEKTRGIVVAALTLTFCVGNIMRYLLTLLLDSQISMKCHFKTSAREFASAGGALANSLADVCCVGCDACPYVRGVELVRF